MQLGYLHRKVSFVSQLVSPVRRTGRCHIPTICLIKKENAVLWFSTSFGLWSVIAWKTSRPAQISLIQQFFSNLCPHCIYEWLSPHVVTDDTLLILDSAQPRVSFGEQHVRGNRVSRDTGPRPIVYPKLCELTHLTASQISLSCSRDT